MVCNILIIHGSVTCRPNIAKSSCSIPVSKRLSLNYNRSLSQTTASLHSYACHRGAKIASLW